MMAFVGVEVRLTSITIRASEVRLTAPVSISLSLQLFFIHFTLTQLPPSNSTTTITISSYHSAGFPLGVYQVMVEYRWGVITAA